MTGQRTSRRTVLTSAAALATSAVFLARPAIAQSAPRVVIVGGGFAGASAARALRRADPRIAITLVEANQTFPACPFSHARSRAVSPLRRAAIRDRESPGRTA